MQTFLFLLPFPLAHNHCLVVATVSLQLVRRLLCCHNFLFLTSSSRASLHSLCFSNCICINMATLSDLSPLVIIATFHQSNISLSRFGFSSDLRIWPTLHQIAAFYHGSLSIFHLFQLELSLLFFIWGLSCTTSSLI